MNDKDYTGQWKTYAPIGLALIGFGFSLTGEAVTAKGKGKPVWQWLLVGTVGLSVLNAGIAIFGEAVKRRALEQVAEARPRSDVLDYLV
jgi:hypothetical protein